MKLISATVLFLCSLVLLWFGGVLSIAAWHATLETYRQFCIVMAGMSFFGTFMLWLMSADCIDEYRGF